MSEARKQAFGIHHVNFPSTDLERTEEWYSKVFHMSKVDIGQFSNTRVMLLQSPDFFELHFTPVEEMYVMNPFHYAVEVKDWDGFLEHLKEVGVRYTKPVERPQNNSKFCYITDPDGTMIELTYHGDREDLQEQQ